MPLKVIKHPQEVKFSSADEDVPVETHGESVGSKTGRESKTKCSPLTGFEVFEIFAKKRHLGELQFYHLKASEDGPYRPYDLQVVPRNKAGSNHYIFSPTSVMHVQDGCSVGLLTLAEWYREAVLWKALQDIPFFRNYLLCKPFRRWKRNVCRIVFQRRRKLLQSQQLTAVPQFREALFHFTRLLEELKKVHWLPQDERRTYTLLEFQTTLLKSNQESQGVLKRFLHYRSLILAMVQETSYKAHQELQHQVEQSQLNQCTQPIHLQHASAGSLSKELDQTEQVLQRLGNIAGLMDCMIVQSLVTISNHEITAFLINVLKREQEQQGSLFQADLTFGEDGQLTIFPPIQLFQEVLIGALLSVGDSALQVFDSCNNSPASKDSLTACFQDLSPSTGLAFLPKRTSLRVQGQRVRGQYYPLSRKQLEWHLRLHARTQDIEKEQARITQEAHQEIQQLCEQHSWLVDTHLFSTQWSTASLESMRGWPAVKYKEHIQKVHLWRDGVSAMRPAFTTSNKLLTVTCSRIQEKLVPLLTTIEEDSLKLMSDELQLHSANLTSKLKKVIERLRREPTDLSDFANYAGMVKRYKEMSADMQQQLDNLCSLQRIIELTPGESACMEQTLHLWKQFVPLLKQATHTVNQQLSSMTNTLDSAVSSLTKELEDLVCSATTGPYLDPNQSTDHMIAELRIISRQFNVIAAQLNELSRSSQSLRGQLLDLTFVTTAKQNIEARKELWELKGVSTAQIQEWRLLLFSKFMVSRAQEKVSEWLQETVSLAKVIPPHDGVLQETLSTLEKFNQQLSILVKLSSPTLKYKHWRNIFNGIGLLYDPEQNLTVADLMSKELLEHQNKINKICREAKASADMEHVFRRLQQGWEGTEFRLAKFIVTVWQTTHSAIQQQSCDSGTFTIMDLKILLAQTEDSIMTLSSMLLSPHAAEFRREVEHWMQLLQELEELLDFCERYQQKWVFLSKLFYETSVSTHKAELLQKFSPVDKTFREMIQFTLSDPNVLNFVQLRKTTETRSQFQGQNLRILFIEGLTVMEEISNQLMHLLDSQRGEFPRLCFLSDGEVIELLQHHLPPSSLLSLVRRCFRGVRWLEVINCGEHDMTDVSNELDLSSTQMWVSGVYGALKEYMPFFCPLEPNLNPVIWFGLLEKKLYQTVKRLMFKCTVARLCPLPKQNDHELDKDDGDIPAPELSCISSTLRKGVEEPSDVPEPPVVLQLITEYPLQCLLVAEEVFWCREIEMAFTDSAQTKWVPIKSQNATKLKSLCQAIRNITANSNGSSLTSQYTVTALRALVLLTMKHAQQVDGLLATQGSLESSFEWQRLMKYQCSAIDQWTQSHESQEDSDFTEHSVNVNVLGTQLAYGYEYVGPENWVMVNTPSTDRAFLGILLALTSFRCAFVSGPLMSGKKQTVFQLGWALGQQVITLSCCASTSSLIVCQMLLGALQTGAWLVLDTVDSMEQGTLSILGQHLTDIHQCLSALQRNTQQKVQELEDDNDKCSPKTRDEDFTTMAEMECKVQFGGKNISANLNFGCVIISSHGYSAEIPENLRVASRPVSLMQPDYSIIAEILLVSLGFSEATSMSRRLITLFNLAKDSFCLPNFVIRNQSSWLVLLRKVIHASGIHLYNNFEKTDEDRFLVRDGPRPVDLPLKGSDKIQEFKDYYSSLCKRTSKFSIINAVREEQAIIKAVMFVLLPAIIEPKKASQFHTNFEEMFPMARFTEEQFIEESKQNLLRNAITDELDRTGFHADTQQLHNAVTLFQTLEFSKAVVLVGPAGSGKTTLYRALAGALRQLAAKSVEAEFEEDIENTKLLSTSCWCSVNTVILFPNAFSHEELFGGSDEQPGTWRDGAFTKVIRDAYGQDHLGNDFSEINQKKVETRKVKWLVLDGEPLSQPGWFDSLSTLVHPRDPFLCLSSGEKVQLSQEDLKIIVESTTLSDATPSTLAQCSLVYVSGKDLWKAVWKAEMDALYRDCTLDQSTLKMWSYLAEDLFSRTLIFLRHNALATVMSSDGVEASKSSPGVTDGLQEVTSFIKILHAFLGESGCGLKTTSKQTEKKDTGPKPFSTELQARNLFAVAYIWGFGGQLHPRYWPHFDILAREALFESRYKIEVPAEGTVFEHFFSLRDGILEHTTNEISLTRKKRPHIPLELMLEAHQPALLVGEAGSGKTTLCKSLSQERQHMHLTASPLLHSAYFCDILESMGSYKTRLASLGTVRQHPGLLLFVDDLHEAPFDNNGKTSVLLENLRQCISRDGVLTSDGYHFKLFSSGAINYLGTCSTFGTNKNSCKQISPRLSRLFTIFVLPDVTVDVLFSIHSTQLQQWLKNFPFMPRIADMAQCIVAATFDIYHAVRKHLHSSAHAPHIVFSLHDLLKVFQGMRLWDPRTPLSPLLLQFAPASLGQTANVLSIARLWMHECLRTFGDRLSSDEEIQKLVSILIQVSEKNFGGRLAAESQTSGADRSGPACDYLNQDQHSTPIWQDKDQLITSRKEFENSSLAELTGRSKQSEESESSEEKSSSGSSFSVSQSDDYSVTSSSRRSKNEKNNPKIDFQSESAPSTSCSPEILCQSPEDSSESSSKTMSQSMALQYELNQSNISTCEKPQASSKLLLRLLLEMGSSACNIVYSPEFCEPHKCIAQQQAKQYSVYQERDLDSLVQQLAHIIKRKEEEDNCISANFAVYRKRVRQLVHILRALLIPGGHGVLFGATKKTGRKTTVRLAAYLTGYQLIEVHCGNEGKLKEILREAMNQIDVHGGHVMFLIHETISQTTRDKLLVAMANGTVPGLYSDEELKDMFPNIGAIMKNSHNPIRTAQVFEKYFRNKLRNLHIFLLLPLNQGSSERQPGQSSVIAPHITKVLSLCFCVEVYQPWGSETLVEIASDHLSHLQISETHVQADKTLVASIAQAMAGIHQSAIKYASTFLNIQQFSPQTYFELMTYFSHLSVHLYEQVRGPANRVATVLAQVKDMTDTAQEYSQELFRLQAKFDETQKWLNRLQTAADTEGTHCEQARQHCLLEEGRLSHLEEQLELADQQAQDALDEVSPLYQAALKALQSLNQSDLEEVRHYRHPPDGVVMLMNAICMLFSRPCNWESGKQLLGQPNFLQELEFFDRSNLNDELFQKLGQVVKAPNFQPHLVRDMSRACESLSCWLQAVYQYAWVQRHMAPREAQKKNLLKRMAESRARLRVARLQEEAARGKLEDMEKQQQLVRKNLEDLAVQLQKVEAQEKEAAAAIKQLSDHTEKWISIEKELKMNNHTISGDALILASAIAYLGPFGPDIRLDLLEKWHKMCLTARISPEDLQSGPQSSCFQDPLFDLPIPVAMELHRIVARALICDLNFEGISDQFLGDVGRSYKEEEYELLVSADDPEFLDKLRHGAEKGLRVLITHTEHAVPSEDFLSILVRPGGSHCLGVFHPVEALHSEFHLFISTALPVRVLLDEIHPSILEKVKVIDLSLSTSEVQDIILNNILQSECSEVWIQHCQAKRDKQVLKDKLHLEEASLMDFMLQSFRPLLQDPEFLPHVSVCQSISLKLHTEIEELSSKIDYHKPLLNEFHRMAVLATDLYKALQEVGRLSPFYSFPLHNFLLVLREALALKGQRDVACSGEVVSGVVMSEISHRMVSHILAQYRPCLLQSHAEVLRLLASVAFFKHNESCSETEHITFLKGISDMESTEHAPSSEQSATELPSWIPLHIQADVRLLEKIPPFHGLVSSLRSSSRQWQEYLRFPSSTVVGHVPCQSHSHLTTLQRAILWKTFFPQWLAAVADDLTACQQGQSLSSGVASGPHTGSPEALSHFLSRNVGPVIVTLPGQSQDESGSIHPLYWIKQVAQYQADKKGVKVTVISFGSKCQRDVLLLALDTAVQTGHWLVLNNCHLLDHWDVEVVSQLKQLMSYTTKGQLAGLETIKGLSLVGRCAENHVHPNFRLWFITKGNAPLSVPAVVRIGAVHLVCGSHWDLKDELCSSLRQVITTDLSATSSRYTRQLVEPLIRCAILHSVLLQRQKLKHLGQGKLYNWTQEDLLALVDAQVHITQHCRDPTEALEYIAAYLTYGGHVSDSADLEVVEAVCRLCLRPAPPIWGSGPHTLSKMIMTGYFDEKDLLKGLEQRVQTTLSSNDSSVLGFSAFMTNEMVKVRSHRLSILLLQSQGSFKAVRGAGVLNHIPKLPDYKKAQERLQALHDKMSYREESRSMCRGTVSLSPLHTFLQTEWEHLTEVVSSLLDIFQLPQVSFASSYVTSSTISKLETRAHLLRTYQSQEYSVLCHVYCLSAFANPRGFLAALIRETVHIRQQDVSHFSLHFQVLDAAVSPASMPSSGICLSGLELHGALWDTRLGVLQDTLSSKPCPLPYLWVRAQERDTDSPHSNSSCSMPLYNCPLYLDNENEDEDWSLSEVNIVTHVPLMTRSDPALCTLRRVRLVSTLQETSFKY
ncbi:dynein heavy chain domain-containing protein 1 [Colossoma macropomum]|uniref:dynein heavy chain domain-containing protein 1 n=1 Tax=Colossoma macropomum TaxID=42526 RepID=UPI0018654DA3|nr:dynein heavy chain domain-containing protein 1 [Colossoma macropomum]